MPKTSERQELLREMDLVMKVMAGDDADETEDFEEVAEMRELIESVRYLNLRDHIDKNKELPDLLWQYSDRDFRQAVRMNKDSFQRLVQLIETDPVFENSAKYKQTPTWIQLMVTLQVLGFDGNGSSVGRNARMSGFSHGSVVLFKKRVFKALLAQKNNFVFWPNEDERKVSYCQSDC